MKNILIVGVLGVAVLVGAVVLTKQGRRSDTPNPSASARADQKNEYRLVVIADSVSLQHTGEATATSVRGSVNVRQGDQVTTSSSGRARLVWPNGTITTLEEDTHITITELADGGSKSRIELVVGDIWSKVNRILGSGEYYEVGTQETVAAVRGTIFRTSYRNKRTRVQGIEHKVRVMARNADGSADTTTGVDVDEDMQAEMDSTTVTSGTRRLLSRRLTAIELKDRILERIRRERVLSDDELLRVSPSVSVAPSTSVQVSPRITTTPRPTISIIPTISVRPSSTPIVTNIATPAPIPIATPVPSVTLDHVFPKTISAGETFSIEGENFTGGRNVSMIASVSVGGRPAADFSVIIGGTSIFVTPAALGPGTYDVSVVTTDGKTLTLPAALTIQ